MIVFLTGPHFDSAAARLGALDLDLHDVHACVFPSRPEPARATFLHGPRPVASYLYVPDDDLRVLRLLTPDPLLTRILDALADLVTADLDALAAPLSSPDPPTLDARRAAACLTQVLTHGADPGCLAAAATHLAAALDPDAPLASRRAVAALLASSASLDLRRRAPALPAILRHATDDPDLDVRLHARRALDAIAF